MEGKQTEEQEAVIKRFSYLIGAEIDRCDLARRLDKVLLGYAMYMLNDPDLCGHPDNTESLYYIKELRDILNNTES